MDIRFVYFDLDDTLLDHRHAERAALSAMRDAFSASFEGINDEALHRTYRACSGPLWRQYAAGAITKNDLKLGRFQQLLAALDIKTVAPEAVSTAYLRHYATHWRFVSGARRAFVQVADRFPVGVLTNGFAEIQTEKLDRFPVLRDRAAAVVISEETGHMKPHAQVFAHAASAADTPAQHILYAGDAYHSDVQGSHHAGWQAAWFRRNDATKPEAMEPNVPPAIVFSEWDVLLDRLT